MLWFAPKSVLFVDCTLLLFVACVYSSHSPKQQHTTTHTNMHKHSHMKWRAEYTHHRYTNDDDDVSLTTNTRAHSHDMFACTGQGQTNRPSFRYSYIRYRGTQTHKQRWQALFLAHQRESVVVVCVGSASVLSILVFMVVRDFGIFCFRLLKSELCGASSIQ